MLREIDTDIWVAEQPFRYFGLSVGTRMTVIRLESRELVVISPIQANDELVNQLNKLGSVSHIIAPNLYHYLFASGFKALYPDATFWAVPGLELKKPDLAIDRCIEKTEDSLWKELDFVFFDGVKTLGLSGFDRLDECVFLHSKSHTLILTDTAFNFDETFPVLTQLITRIMGGYKRLSPSLLERTASTEKDKVRASVAQILNWNFDRVIVAHGNIVERDGKEKFRQGYTEFFPEES